MKAPLFEQITIPDTYGYVKLSTISHVLMRDRRTIWMLMPPATYRDSRGRPWYSTAQMETVVGLVRPYAGKHIPKARIRATLENTWYSDLYRPQVELASACRTTRSLSRDEPTGAMED